MEEKWWSVLVAHKVLEPLENKMRLNFILYSFIIARNTIVWSACNPSERPVALKEKRKRKGNWKNPNYEPSSLHLASFLWSQLFYSDTIINYLENSSIACQSCIWIFLIYFFRSFLVFCFVSLHLNNMSMCFRKCRHDLWLFK